MDHGCFHAQFGPFQTVTGSASTTGTAPNINTIHTQYTVNLTSGGGSVTYRPARSGDWTMMIDPGISVTVLDPGGAEVPLLLTDSNTGCSQLPLARVYNLTANTVYRFVFGPSSAATVDIVMEKLSDFEAFYYRDADADGYGFSDDATITACDAPAGRVTDDSDCNDASATVNPAASEVANGVDDNCNGEVDEGTAPLVTYYRDADGDGYGNASESQQATSAPAGFVTNDDDCNDASATVNPDAEEICDGLDNDCNGEVDDLEDALGEIIEHACQHAELGPFQTIGSGEDLSAPHTAYTVKLTESAGSFNGSANFEMFEAGEKIVMLGADQPVRLLNEAGEEITAERSASTEGCEALAAARLYDLEAGWYRLEFGPTDQSSVLVVLEAGDHDHEEESLYADADGDGFGDPDRPLAACGEQPGVDNADDCDDSDPALNPEAEEVCDEVDNDCDGTVDAVDGASVCDASCGPVEIVARQSYSPNRAEPGQVELATPVAMQIPRQLPLSAGCALVQRASLRIETDARRAIKCDYIGLGTQYRLLRCTGRVRGGETVQASKVSLSVKGLRQCGPTEVRLTLADNVCQ